MPLAQITETRTRPIPFKGLESTMLSETFNSSGLSTSSRSYATWAPSVLNGMQTTASTNHPSWNNPKGRSGDVGGNFFTQKSYVEGNFSKTRLVGSNFASRPYREYRRTFDGYVLATGNPGPFPGPMASSDGELEAWGTKGISVASPTNSLADLSTFLGETLTSGLPKLAGAAGWEKGTDRARKAPGQEYLNYEFGWKPIVNDVQEIARALARADAVIRQYRRDSGRVVRRRMSFPPVESTSVSVFKFGANAFITPSASPLTDVVYNQGQVNRIRTTTIRRWFSGAFTYHLALGGDSFSKMVRAQSEAKKLLGFSLTPDTLWNLAPWSWAVDWFTNTGDVIENITSMAVDGMVLKYGYVMEHTIVRDTYTFVGHPGLVGNPRPNDITMVTETKKRRKATPFGFGLTWDGFSPRQLAIIAALGITKG